MLAAVLLCCACVCCVKSLGRRWPSNDDKPRGKSITEYTGIQSFVCRSGTEVFPNWDFRGVNNLHQSRWIDRSTSGNRGQGAPGIVMETYDTAYGKVRSTYLHVTIQRTEHLTCNLVSENAI